MIAEILSSIPLPKFVRVRQQFDRPVLHDIGRAVQDQLTESGIRDKLGTGARIAVTAGSRGIANQVEILSAIVDGLGSAGAKPFIVPAMGSHGGASADGQRDLLEGMGVTEHSVGAPIESSMEVTRIGTSASGLPVYIDSHAAGADGIVLVNRIKPHVSFRGSYESGLFKMMAIGLGKQHGAQICHDLGFAAMARNVEEFARTILAGSKIVGGVAVLENAFHETARIEAMSADRIPDREPVLLKEAQKLSACLYLDEIDVLVIDQIGKDISGTGFDTNVVGRYHSPAAAGGGGPNPKRLVVLDLTEASHGNANGVGIADFTTERLYRKIDFEQTYPNSLTSTVPLAGKIPMVLPNDRLAIQAAIRTSNRSDKSSATVVRIRNTSNVNEILVSENLADTAAASRSMEVLGPAEALSFDPSDNLF
jgi:hypothetical protein